MVAAAARVPVDHQPGATYKIELAAASTAVIVAAAVPTGEGRPGADDLLALSCLRKGRAKSGSLGWVPSE